MIQSDALERTDR